MLLLQLLKNIKIRQRCCSTIEHRLK